MARPTDRSDQPLRPYLARTKRTFWIAFWFSLAANIFMLLVPLYSMQVLDRVIGSRSIETLIALTSIMLVGIVLFAIFGSLRATLLNQVSHWLDMALAPRLLEDAIVKSSYGSQVNAAQHQRDLGSIKSFITNGTPPLLDAPWSLLYVLIIYVVSPVMGILAIVGIVMLLLFGVVNEYATRKLSEKSSEDTIRSNQLADTASRNAEAVETMGMMQNIVRHWQRLQRPASDISWQSAQRINFIQAVSRCVRLLLQIAVTGLGAVLVLNNDLTTGGMIASSILVGRALAPFEGAIGIWRTWVGAREAYNRLNNNLASGVQHERGTLELPQPDGHIAVENIIYTPPKAPPIIKGVSFRLNAGESMGIIGPSAAGKSTLSKLIIGLLPPTHGAARLDGVETFKWNRENFGKYVGYMPQNVDLFSGTIKDNIARMDVDAPIEPVIDAAKMAGVHDMILRLPNGYETQFDLARHSLSPGQRQRIGLARALYGKPRFVLLDEPNLNLDGEGERALLAALKRMKEAKITYIVVAHRPTIVSMVDKILVLKAGVIERFGPRDEVLRMYTPAGGAKGGEAGVGESDVGAVAEGGAL